jgi:hypothetical protein
MFDATGTEAHSRRARASRLISTQPLSMGSADVQGAARLQRLLLAAGRLRAVIENGPAAVSESPRLRWVFWRPGPPFRGQLRRRRRLA